MQCIYIFKLHAPMCMKSGCPEKYPDYFLGPALIEAQRSWTIIDLHWPNQVVFGSEVIVRTPSKNYTSSLSDMMELTEKLGIEHFSTVYERLSKEGK